MVVDGDIVGLQPNLQ